MTRAFRSEWLKLRRRGMLLAGGTLIAFAALSATFTMTGLNSTDPQQGPGGDSALTASAVATEDGLAAIGGAGAQFAGVVLLGLFAYSFASEFSGGTLRNLLVAQPRRVSLLVGKTLALGSFAVVAMTLAYLVSSTIAFGLASGQEVETSAWFTSGGLTATLGGLGNIILAGLGWGILGGVLGLAFRSPAPALGVGLAYALPIEALLSVAWEGGSSWLPGQVLSAVAGGGTADAPYLYALGLVGLYCAASAIASAMIFRKMDVLA